MATGFDYKNTKWVFADGKLNIQDWINETPGMRQQWNDAAEAYSTELASNLSLIDANIHVVNANVLPTPNPEMAIPGIVHIGGEKIYYYSIDRTNNILGNIRRSVDGSASQTIHFAGIKVVDGSIEQIIPGTTTEVTEVFTGNGVQQVFTCSNISTLYPESVMVTVGNAEVRNVVVTNYPVLTVKFFTPPTGFITIKADVDTSWLNMTGNTADGTGLDSSSAADV